VRAETALGDQRDARIGDCGANRLEFARFGPRILCAVHDQRRNAQLGQASAVEIVVWPAALVGDAQPGDAVDANQIAPGIAVLSGENAGDPLAQAVGILHHRLEELARLRLAAVQVRRLDDERGEPLRPGEAHLERNHRAVAVPPHDRTLESERVEHRKRFAGGAIVEIGFLCSQPS